MSLSDRISSLQEELGVGSESSSKKGKLGCANLVLILAVLVPIIVWFFLYYVSPNFVKDDMGMRVTKKVLLYTVIITLVIWAGLFLLGMCSGYDIKSMLCLKK